VPNVLAQDMQLGRRVADVERGSTMFRRMIVPLDGTRFAEAALAPARELARLFGAHILVVRAEDLTGLPRIAAAPDVQVQLERVDEADAYLHEIVDALQKAGCNADLAIALAAPGAGIAHAAELNHADLIVLATHLRWDALLAQDVSTTLQLLARTHVPLLVWRVMSTAGQRASGQSASAAAENEPSLLLRPGSPLLVPLDGSRLAERALPVAEALALTYALGTSLVLVRAVDRTSFPSGAQTQDEQAEGVRAFSTAQAYLLQIQEALAARGIPATAITRIGAPLGVINGVLRECDASLIVMASHGQSGVLGRFLGTVAAHIIEEVDAPVLVVHPESVPEVC